MEVKNMLLEVELQTSDNKINELFNYALGQMFQKWYLDKINEKIYNMVKIEEIRDKRNIVAWQKGGKIFVNAPVFYAKQTKLQVRYLLHEFLHVLQRNKKLLFFRQFKELDDLGRKLNIIVRGNLVKPLSVFLTGKNVDLPTDSQEEILAYLMNDKIDWSAIKPEARRAFINELEKSRIFNLKTDFWQRRLI